MRRSSSRSGMSILTKSSIFLFLSLAAVHGYLYDMVDWSKGNFLCGGCLQSPVDLISIIAEKVRLGPLLLNNFDKVDEVELENNGDTLVLHTNTYLNATVTGGNNHEVFKVGTIYFHWAAEHPINFKIYDLEMQIASYNSDLSDMEKAFERVNGFLNLAVLFKATTNVKKVPEGIKSICYSLDRIRFAGRATTLDDFPLSSLFTGLNKEEYFTYCGSFTVPPCTPNVVWIVFQNPLDIPTSCLAKLRTLVSNNGKNMTETRRDPSILGVRKVFRTII